MRAGAVWPRPCRWGGQGVWRGGRGVSMGRPAPLEWRVSGRLEPKRRAFAERVTRQGEEAIGKLAQELLENPVVSRRAVGGVGDARAGDACPGGRAGRAQPALGERSRAADAPPALGLAAAGGRSRTGSTASSSESSGLDDAPLEPSGSTRSRPHWSGSSPRCGAIRLRYALTAAPLGTDGCLGQRAGGHRPEALLADPQRVGRSILVRAGSSRSETSSSAAAWSSAPLRQREQRRRLHLDRDRSRASHPRSGPVGPS